MSSSFSTADLRSRSAFSSATSSSNVFDIEIKSSARRRSFASRRSAWIVAAFLATSACLPSGLSWRRSSTVKSWTRARFACIESNLRSAFSFRLRCFSTPAASSIKPRRSSGVAIKIASSWPCPTITCISRPIPESLSNSWISNKRDASPLIWYSLCPFLNKILEIVTSV